MFIFQGMLCYFTKIVFQNQVFVYLQKVFCINSIQVSNMFIIYEYTISYFKLSIFGYLVPLNMRIVQRELLGVVVLSKTTMEQIFQIVLGI